MTMTPDQLEAAGFREGADDGLFFTKSPTGEIARFGVRRSDGDGYRKDSIITIDWSARTAQREDRTVAGFPHPDADPTITLDQHLQGWLEEIVSSDSFKQVCGFCGKQNTEVARLIAGPSAMICNECVGLCQEILADGP
jgi:hypothetical protein